MISTDPRYSRLSLDVTDHNGHVLYHRFGLEQADRQGLLDQMLRETPAVRPVAAAQLSLMAYQTDYGIYNHTVSDPNRPLALIAMHPKENTFEGGPILSLIRRFHNFRIQELGVSMVEFFNLPYPQAMFLFELAEHNMTKNTNAVDKADAELAKELGKLA